ncbi:MAG: hypothetical protein EOM06_15130 [Sphingobacteriia bacterium]|nr:hypothetical protein [Sphingobacteriia bacterium]
MKQTVASEIYSRLQAIESCKKAGNTEWEDKHSEALRIIEKDILPSGSGIDCGTKIDRDFKPNKIKLICSFHHMDENGYYDGWTEHVITVTPVFDGINIKISGKNKNFIKEYLADVYFTALSQTVEL